jgi:hypothetical protein
MDLMHRSITDEDFGQAKNDDQLVEFLSTRRTQRKKEFVNASYYT